MRRTRPFLVDKPRQSVSRVERNLEAQPSTALRTVAATRDSNLLANANP